MMNYRHGDIALIGISKMPDGLKPSKIKVLHNGKSNSHTFDNGVFFPKIAGVVLGYLDAQDTKLYHPEHGKVVKGKKLREAKIKDGVYEVRVQQEMTHEGMRPVQD